MPQRLQVTKNLKSKLYLYVILNKIISGFGALVVKIKEYHKSSKTQNPTKRCLFFHQLISHKFL